MPTLLYKSNVHSYGYGYFSPWSDNTALDAELDDMKAKGVEWLRIDIADYQNTAWVNAMKNGILRAKAKNMKVIAGVSSNTGNSPSYVLTAANWPQFRQAQLDFAAWFEANAGSGDHLSIGNEEELHNDNTTLTDAQVRTNLKSICSEIVGIIYTKGPVVTAISQGNRAAWISEGKGSFTKLAFNVYSDLGIDEYLKKLKEIFTAFGTNAYIAEFNLHVTGSNVAAYSQKEFTKGVSTLFAMLREVGFDLAIFFCYNQSQFGMKRSGVYMNAWGDLYENTNMYFKVNTSDKATALTKGATISTFTHKKPHSVDIGGSPAKTIVQAEYTQADITYFESLSGASYYKDYVLVK